MDDDLFGASGARAKSTPKPKPTALRATTPGELDYNAASIEVPKGWSRCAAAPACMSGAPTPMPCHICSPK